MNRASGETRFSRRDPPLRLAFNPAPCGFSQGGQERRKTMASKTQHFTVSGMQGPACEQKVNKAIRSLDPQAQVTASATQGSVDIQQTSQSRQALGQAIEQAGYSVQS